MPNTKWASRAPSADMTCTATHPTGASLRRPAARPRRRAPLWLSVLVPVLVLTASACSDDATDASAGAPAATEAGSEGAPYPIDVDHALGTTTVSERPERIVTLSVQWTDAVLAMGLEPVGYVLDQASGETAPYPWQDGALDAAERIDTSGSVPFERIAALEPDLILTSYLGTEGPDLAKLEAIAPTIGLLGDLQVDPWQDQIETLGRILDDNTQAREVMADVEGRVAALAEELPGLEGKTYVAANYVEGDGIYVVADPEDGASRLFYALGMEIAPQVLALDEQAVGRVQISTEQVDVLDADFLGILTNGSDSTALPGWNQLTAVKSGAVVDFELADVIGLNTPTPLSVPYVMDLIRPRPRGRRLSGASGEEFDADFRHLDPHDRPDPRTRRARAHRPRRLWR